MREKRSMLSGFLISNVAIACLFSLVIIIKVGDLVKTVINCFTFRKASEKAPCNDFTGISAGFPQCAMF